MQYLPSVLRATSSQSLPLAQDQLAATQATEPAYQQLNADLTAQYAPSLARTNAEVQRIQSLEGAETNRQQLVGAGGDAARAAMSLDRETNPDYWKVQDAASNKAVDLLGAVNLNGLSPGEAAAVERSLNQNNTSTGNLGVNNATNTVANAMQFGGAFNSKLDRAANAITTATGTAQGARNTGFSPVNVALGQPSTSGMTQFQQSGSQGGATQGALSFGSGLLSDRFGMNSAAIGAAASRANANSVPSYIGSMPSYS